MSRYWRNTFCSRPEEEPVFQGCWNVGSAVTLPALESWLFFFFFYQPGDLEKVMNLSVPQILHLQTGDVVPAFTGLLHGLEWMCELHEDLVHISRSLMLLRPEQCLAWQLDMMLTRHWME